MYTSIAVALLVCYGLLFWFAATGEPHRAERWLRLLFVALQGGILALVMADWAYGTAVVMPYHFLAHGHSLFMAPFALALSALVGFVFSRRLLGVVLVVVLAQLVVFVPILIYYGNMYLVSFYSWPAVVTLGASFTSLFVLLLVAIHRVPQRDSRIGRIAFGGRRALLEAVEVVARRRGLEYAGPSTILETGSARGSLGRWHVAISTRPVGFPPRYALTVSVAPTGVEGTDDAGQWPSPEGAGRRLQLPEGAGITITRSDARWQSRSSSTLEVDDATLDATIVLLVAAYEAVHTRD